MLCFATFLFKTVLCQTIFRQTPPAPCLWRAGHGYLLAVPDRDECQSHKELRICHRLPVATFGNSHAVGGDGRCAVRRWHGHPHADHSTTEVPSALLRMDHVRCQRCKWAGCCFAGLSLENLRSCCPSVRGCCWLGTGRWKMPGWRTIGPMPDPPTHSGDSKKRSAPGRNLATRCKVRSRPICHWMILYHWRKTWSGSFRGSSSGSAAQLQMLRGNGARPAQNIWLPVASLAAGGLVGACSKHMQGFFGKNRRRTCIQLAHVNHWICIDEEWLACARRPT